MGKKIEILDFKTPKATKMSSVLCLETPVLGEEKINLKPKAMNLTLTPSADEGSPYQLPMESQPSPANLKRKREEESQPKTPFILRNVKTPETPYGAFLGKKCPSKNTRKYWKVQWDEMGRFEMTEEQKAE